MTAPASTPGATPDPAAPAPAPSPLSASPAAPRGVFEWFWRGKSLRLARGYVKQLPQFEQTRLKHAQVALELAERAHDPVDPLRTGSSLGLSISLYREAAYWALLAQDESYSGPDLASLFRTLPAELLEFVAGGPEGLKDVRRALVERSFADTAALPAENLPREAQLARDFVHALLLRKLQPTKRVGRLLLQRGMRSFGLIVLLAIGVSSAVLAYKRATLQPDLAAGKPWRASSALDICRPQEHYCAAARTDIFFCTIEEPSPWVEIDLGKPTSFSVIEIANRTDCCPDRAAPLAVEVSNDQQHFREVVRRQETFNVWQTKVAPQTARYVRVRALRRTILHLDRVTVRAG